MTAIKTSPELLMTFILVTLLACCVWANHVHNNNLVQIFVGLAGQAFASITTLVVKGQMGSNSGSGSQTALPPTPQPTVTAQVESTTPKEKP